ncbi:MAG TPA: DALR anticodon-binding domain-containing protein, partial [Blastocatellia bacterium]|nr:DALR anticodon-binding domain-containing protein [Blastocatellia bacterium]
DSKESEHEADKVIVRSNGTVTYTGKDIAFHLWKLGQLGNLDFYYKKFRMYPDGSVAWITTSAETENDKGHPGFGSAAAYFNVIDIGQSYPQQYVKVGVIAASADRRAEKSAHVAYEKVVLSPATAEQLGQQVSDEDRKRGVVSMSGRKGLGVKTDDFIDQLEDLAFREVSGRQTDLSADDQREIARKIAVGALRYFLLKYTRTSVICFDFKEALAMVGETGVYIQNAVVRANSIFRKLEESGIQESPEDLVSVAPERITELLSGEAGEQLWALVYLASRLPETVRAAVGSLEPAHVAKWAFQVAQSFHTFYEKHHIKSETDAARRTLLIAITALVRRQLVEALRLLGIETPERM